MTIDDKALACWVGQIRARLPKYLTPGRTFDEAVALAHDDLQSFIGEMATGETDRAKLVIDALASDVYAELRGPA
jgi:hypothetical protein